VCVVALALTAAGCGTKHPKAISVTTTTTTPSLHATVRKLYGSAYANPVYNQAPWAVVQIGRGSNAKVVVFHLAGARWLVDRSHSVKVIVFGPKPGSTHPPITQVAMAVRSPGIITQSALFLDGLFLPAKVAGNPHDYTVYGAPTYRLKQGLHVVIGFGSTKTHGTAVLWTYRVR
jgi:hypothetical protein